MAKGNNQKLNYLDSDNDCLDNSDEDNRHQCSKICLGNFLFLFNKFQIPQMIENVMPKPNLHAKKINLGAGLSAFLKSGCVTEIRTVLMVLMKIQLCTIVQRLNHVLKINLHARMVDALTKDGLATTITIAVMDPTRENSAIHNTKHARPKSLHVRTSNAFEINTDAVRCLLNC